MALSKIDYDDLVGGAFVYSNTSDPTSTGQNATLGDTWLNTSTGELFVCSDATTGDNGWKSTDNLIAPASIAYSVSYDTDNKINILGTWSKSNNSSNSNHYVTDDANGVRVAVIGSSTTAIGIYTIGYHGTAFPMPSNAVSIQYKIYVDQKDSNQVDNSGEVHIRMGSTANGTDYFNTSLTSTINALTPNDDVLLTYTQAVPAGAKGQDVYFSLRGYGGQYANVDVDLKEIRILFS